MMVAAAPRRARNLLFFRYPNFVKMWYNDTKPISHHHFLFVLEFRVPYNS